MEWCGDGVGWGEVVWSGAMRCCGVEWCYAVLCGGERCGAVWCGVGRCGGVGGVVWSDVVWCGVVWCDVMWCGVCGVV